MNMIARMMHIYMKNPRYVMLMIVLTNVDIAIQEILKKVEDVNPNNIKTLEVLTKPNLVDKDVEKNVINLIEDKFY